MKQDGKDAGAMKEGKGSNSECVVIEKNKVEKNENR